VHPGYTVLLLDCKECIGNAELIMCTELEEPLTIFIALADTCMPEADDRWSSPTLALKSPRIIREWFLGSLLMESSSSL